jgi:hypothetical protein
MTRPFNPVGRVCEMRAGRALSGCISGSRTRAAIPVSVMRNAMGTMTDAVSMSDRLAMCGLREQKILENMSGPTRNTAPTKKRKVRRSTHPKSGFMGKER